MNDLALLGDGTPVSIEPEHNPFDAPGEYVPPVKGHKSTKKSASKSTIKSTVLVGESGEELAGLWIEPPFTLGRLLRSEEVMELVVKFLGLPESAVGWNDRGSAFLFGPKTPSHRNGIYMVGEWFFAWKTGELRKFTPSENAVWGTRLFVEMGLLDPAPVESVPTYWFRWKVGTGRWSMRDVTWNRLRVLAGFRCLAGIHWLTFPGRPVAFTRHYAAAWCGMGVKPAYDAIRWLERQGHIHSVNVKGRRAKHWLPGKRKPPEGGSQTDSPIRTTRPQQGASEDFGTDKDIRTPWAVAARRFG